MITIKNNKKVCIKTFIITVKTQKDYAQFLNYISPDTHTRYTNPCAFFT